MRSAPKPGLRTQNTLSNVSAKLWGSLQKNTGNYTVPSVNCPVLAILFQAEDASIAFGKENGYNFVL